MKTRYIIIMLICHSILLSCRIVEVSSISRNFSIRLLTDKHERYQVWLINGSGSFTALTPAKPGVYSISVPAMDGGYSEFISIKYNKHIPEEYTILQIKKAGTVMKEMSIRDVEKLPKVDGSYQLKLE